MNNIKVFKNGKSQSTIENARLLAKNLSIRCAAGYLRNRGFSVEAAIYILTGR